MNPPELFKYFVERLNLSPLPTIIPTLHIFNPQERVSHTEFLLDTLLEVNIQHKTVNNVITNLGTSGAETNVIGKLEDIQAELRRRQMIIRNALVPIHALPPEVLMNIFPRAVSASTWSTDCALAISQTCFTWRAVALASMNAELWQDINVKPMKYRKTFPVVLLKRAANLALSLHLNANDASSLLLNRGELRRRWKGVSIKSALGGAGLTWIPHVPWEALPILERLIIHYPHVDLGRRVAPMNTEGVLDGELPALRYLELGNFAFRGVSAPLLEHLDLSRVHFIEPRTSIPKIFGNCPRLKTFHLDIVLVEEGDGSYETRPETNGMYHMADLEVLSLRRFTSDVMLQILWIVHAPNLQKITISRDASETGSAPGVLEVPNLLEKSSNLGSLRLGRISREQICKGLDAWVMHGFSRSKVIPLALLKKLTIWSLDYDLAPDNYEAIHESFVQFCALYIPTVGSLPALEINQGVFDLDREWYSRRFNVEPVKPPSKVDKRRVYRNIALRPQ